MEVEALLSLGLRPEGAVYAAESGLREGKGVGRRRFFPTNISYGDLWRGFAEVAVVFRQSFK